MDAHDVLAERMINLLNWAESEAKSRELTFHELNQKVAEAGIDTTTIIGSLEAHGCVVDWDKGVIRCPSR